MKRSIINKAASLLIAAVAWLGCSQDDLLMYEQDARVYFQTYQAVDVTFSTEPASVTKDTLFIPVRIIGSATDKDRVFNIIIDDSSTAKKGYHFDFGPLVIPANAYITQLPVYIYRKPGLKDSVVNAYLTIGESADFKPGYSKNLTGTALIDRLHYKIFINDQLLKPTNWDTKWMTYFGTYSKTKHIFISQTYGAGWINVSLPQDLNFLVQTVKYALYNYELTNGPLIDETGARVVFP